MQDPGGHIKPCAAFVRVIDEQEVERVVLCKDCFTSEKGRHILTNPEYKLMPAHIVTICDWCIKKVPILKAVDSVIDLLEKRTAEQKFIYNGPGVCAKCNSNTITYWGNKEMTRETAGLASIPYWCKGCGHKGKEWYSLDYLETE